MFETLLQRFRPLRLKDPLFGPLRFQRTAMFWEGHTQFAPLGHPVECLIEATEAGPTDVERALWQEVESRYASILPQVTPLIEREQAQAHGHENERYIQGMLSAETHELVCIALNVLSSTPVELSFEGTASGDHIIVPLTDWRPTDIVVEPC